MQVVSPGVGVHIEHFTAEEEAGHEAALHGRRIHFLHGNAAAGHNGLGHRTALMQVQGDMLEGFLKQLTLRAGDCGTGFVPVNACDLREESGKTLGKQGLQNVGE